MKFYVDIADLGAIRRIAEFFPIEGFTTNPKILTKAPTPLPALMAEYREFVEQTGLTAFVQTTAETADGMLAQAKALQAYFGEHFVVKLPAVPEGYRAVRLCKAAGIPVCVTVVHSMTQALVAATAGADYVAPYVSRIDNLGADGVACVTEMVTAFRNGGYRQGYSDAWWEQRSNLLHTNMSTVIYVAVAVIVLWVVIKQLDKRFHILNPLRFVGRKIASVKLVSQVGWSTMMLRNPYDACYGIKREKRASWLSAVIVLLAFFVLYVANKYFAGFLFKSMPDGYYELINDFLIVFGLFLLLTICCYLVCTITDGEARFRDIFISAAYALIPMIVFLPIRLVLTNVLTYNEEFFITLIDFVSIGWTALLIVLMLMYQNDYTLKQTLKTIFLTLFCVLVVVALMVVLYMLISQLVDFVVSIYGEVVYRFVKKV